ncbi:hypothetical protein PEC18_11740 [Paucibacter sp. O1-1]|nr:hypothetical protein [Paucibacter sp. O1-1]MDA3826495.1 hypothetical protein [Paucibacter sp. O1-1]
MSATAPLVQAPRLDAAQVLAEARAVAFNTLDPAACFLVDIIRLCFDTDPQSLAALERACFLVAKHAEANEVAGIEAEPWPLPQGELFRRLAAYLGYDLKHDRNQARGWACFRALRDGADRLATAAKLETRDGHTMRRPGGLRLAPSAFNGERLRAQVLAIGPSLGVPGGDVLRITWEDTGRLVVQSKPGRFGEVDCTAEPE